MYIVTFYFSFYFAENEILSFLGIELTNLLNKREIRPYIPLKTIFPSLYLHFSPRINCKLITKLTSGTYICASYHKILRNEKATGTINIGSRILLCQGTGKQKLLE